MELDVNLLMVSIKLEKLLDIQNSNRKFVELSGFTVNVLMEEGELLKYLFPLIS